ncbi:Tetraspanin-17 [Penaeus vannamei]|uniref:Tetraspanin-17 n=1 Tax=Penaeus vannamei TaxID=6689 RepID=A0A423U1U8_PENVA|nr:CD151 antigen-like [Penaeus vannamei]ROT82644.1 Tetraspanin-17 [Penaeus vannamei]
MIASGLLEAGVGIWCFVDSDLASKLDDVPLLYNSSAPPSSSTSRKSLEVAYLPMEEGEYGVSQSVLHLKSWYGQPAHAEYTRVVDHVQERLSCCGLTGPKDYLSSEWEEQANASFAVVPRSCCITILPEDAAAVPVGRRSDQGSAVVASSRGSWREYGGEGGCDVRRLSPRHSQGCLQLLPSWVKQNFAATGGALLVVALFQISGAVVTIVLRKQFKSFGCRDVPPIETLLF